MRIKKLTLVLSSAVGIALIAAVVLIWSGINSGSKKNTNADNYSATNVNTSQSTTKTMNYSFPGVLSADRIAKKKVVITTAKGVIEFSLKSDVAPKTVSNFVYLAEQGFYNGLTFHRVEPGFVIQGGDPAGNGTGGPGYKFEDEPVQGEYLVGSVSMANSGPNTNGSQFFIALDDLTTKLPKQYNLFGQVTKGLDVVKQITVGDVMEKVEVVAE